MRFEITTGDPNKIKIDLLVLWLFEGVKTQNQLINSVIDEEKFIAKSGEILLVHTHGKLPAKKILVVGLGKKQDFSLESVRKATGKVVNCANKINTKTIIAPLIADVDAKECAQAMAEGAILASYKFEKYKTKDIKHETLNIEKFTIIEKNAEKIKSARYGLTLGEIMAHATCYARDLVNEPPAALTPKIFANHAKELVVEAPDYTISVETFDKTQLAKMGAGAILAIAQGSVEEPYLIHLRYAPVTNPKFENLNPKRIALVGKGVTFDSGGLSLKPDHHMYDMKFDMAGGAAVMGVFSVLGRLKPDMEIHGIIPAVENLPSGTSIKPGDVVKSLSGKTIEIVNTDAEGRVILADALEYAKRQKPDAIIDLATLTGAVMVALGERIAGLMSNNENLLNKIRAAADSAGERVWPLPLVDGYEDEIKSDVADVTNTHKTRYGGVILGGLFLKEFVDPQTPWVHLDIAGPVYNAKPWAPYHPKGATGFGVRTILNYILNQ